MHAPQRRIPKSMHQFHKSKQHLVGNQAGHAPPAWRVPGSSNGMSAPLTTVKGKQPAQDAGSKILISMLPPDVLEAEVEELFRKTVGPVKDSFMICNTQGRSKGMAIVTFQRAGDAAIARAKYHGKIVDGRRPIKIEIVVDSDKLPGAPAPTQAPPSLFSRLSAPTNPKAMQRSVINPAINVTPRALPNTPLQLPAVPVPPRKIRQKKGPRRVNKRMQMVHKSREELDREMEDYQAKAPASDIL